LLTEEAAMAVAGKPDQIRTALTPNPIFEKPPYVFDRSHFAASRPLLVIFEEPACSECTNLHANVLSQKEVRQTLMRFEVARFDAKDDKTPILAPDGRKATPAQWYEQNDFTQTPAILFFDENGNKVLETDALVLSQRMMNTMNYVLEKAYEKGWTYQRFARSKAIERLRNGQ
jgi:thioredoxin-related protein